MPPPNEIDCGLVASAEQEDDIGGEFLIRKLVAGFLCLHQVRREVVAGLAPAQLKQMLEVIRRTEIEGILLLDFGRTERARSSRRPPLRELAWKICRSSSGIPSMSQITVTGSLYAKSAIRSRWPRGWTRSIMLSTMA